MAHRSRSPRAICTVQAAGGRKVATTATSMARWSWGRTVAGGTKSRSGHQNPPTGERTDLPKFGAYGKQLSTGSPKLIRRRGCWTTARVRRAPGVISVRSNDAIARARLSKVRGSDSPGNAAAKSGSYPVSRRRSSASAGVRSISTCAWIGPFACSSSVGMTDPFQCSFVLRPARELFSGAALWNGDRRCYCT